jgi:hypothetical protein
MYIGRWLSMFRKSILPPATIFGVEVSLVMKRAYYIGNVVLMSHGGKEE